MYQCICIQGMVQYVVAYKYYKSGFDEGANKLGNRGGGGSFFAKSLDHGAILNSLFRLVAPCTSWIVLFGMSKVLASNVAMAWLALPFSGGAVTRMCKRQLVCTIIHCSILFLEPLGVARTGRK